MIIIVVDVVKFAENTTCSPNKLILLTNCTLNYSDYNSYSFQLPEYKTTDDNRTLSMILPYPFSKNEENDLLIRVITHNKSSKPLIRVNLSMIQCSNKNLLMNWTSLEYSSTLRGEFVRTTFVDKNIMYLPSGRTYLKNLTILDCLTKTLYRTDHKQLFKLDLRIESTLDDYCSDDILCYPLENYQCDQVQHRCTCRDSFQSYSVQSRYSICINVVQNIDQCKMKNIRCLEWCHENSSSTVCTCPKNISTKISLDNDRAYCESYSGGTCNSLIQCPLNEICLNGVCHNRNYKSYHLISIHIITITIIVSCLFLLSISIILGISVYILRRQRVKQDYHRPIEIICTKPQHDSSSGTKMDYDNINYDSFRNNVQLSSSDDNESTPMTTSDDCTYEPKIVYLGGEQQLTAIFA